MRNCEGSPESSWAPEDPVGAVGGRPALRCTARAGRGSRPGRRARPGRAGSLRSAVPPGSLSVASRGMNPMVPRSFDAGAPKRSMPRSTRSSCGPPDGSVSGVPDPGTGLSSRKKPLSRESPKPSSSVQPACALAGVSALKLSGRPATVDLPGTRAGRPRVGGRSSPVARSALAELHLDPDLVDGRRVGRQQAQRPVAHRDDADVACLRRRSGRPA